MAQPLNDDPFKNIRIDPPGVKRSYQWYRAQIAQLGNVQAKMTRALNAGGPTIMPGGLYLFRYDPKWKEELPYYDTLPLVLPFNKVDDGFYGINLHYLSYPLRFKLMGALLSLVRNIKDPRSRAKVSWDILNSSSKFKGVEPCVKHYLLPHVRSQFLQIPNDQWVTASMMPIEQFKKATKQKVFNQSSRMI